MIINPIKWIKDSLVIVDSKSRKLLFLSSLLGILWFGVEISFVYILQIFLLSLKILSPNQLQIPAWFPMGIYQSSILLISFGIIRSTLNYFKGYFSAVTQHVFIRSCREQAIEFGLDSKYFLSTSDFITFFSDRIFQSGVFLQFLSLGLVSFFAVVLFFIFGLFYAPKEMIFSLSTTIVLMLPIKKATHKIQAIGESLLNEYNNINEEVLNSKRNLFFLSVYNLIGHKKKEIQQIIAKYEQHYSSYASTSSWISSIPLFVGVSVLSFCTCLSSLYFHTNGVKVLSFFYVFLRLVQGLSELNSITGALKLNYPFFKNVRETLLILKSEGALVVDNKNAVDLKMSDEKISITFNNIAFSYPNELPLYQNLNMKLSCGDIFIIKGVSGSGKSTLLKLLLGLEVPNCGQILINEVDVLKLSSSWRMKLGYVGPDPYLIKGSIRDNLNFGNFEFNKYSDTQYWEALGMAGLGIELQNAKISLDTVLSELSFLSTGQKQRLAIARAFLRKPQLIILDEATANLDLATEEQILQNLLKISSNVITIIVTHKKSFDKIGTKFIEIGVTH